MTAGPHQLGVTFLKNPSSLLETKRQPYQAHYNMHRHPRLTPAVYQVTITGPFDDGPRDTPSRRRHLRRRGRAAGRKRMPAPNESCANLMRRAYRRPVTDADLDKPMQFYREADAAADFDAGHRSGR